MFDMPFIFNAGNKNGKQFVYNGKSFYITTEEFLESKEQGVFQLLTQRNLADFSHIPEYLKERLH